MKQSRHAWAALWLLAGVLALTGCGSSDDGNGGASGNGTVTEPWTTFCTATFTVDTQFSNGFDEPAFTARAGDEFLLSDFDDSFGGRAEILYLASAGPDSFEVEPGADGTWPFTSNCTIGEGVPYYAVFASVSVFSEKELSTKVCDLPAGSVLPAGGSGRGYSFAGAVQGAAIYEVILGPFSKECAALDRGFVRVPQTQAFGSSTYLVPFAGIIGPE